MRSPWSLAVAALTAAVLAPAAAAAVPKPHYARSYRGTISGKFVSHSGETTITENWTISGVSFRLYKTRAFEGGWTGLYKLTAGTVRYSASESGPCSFKLDWSLPLAGKLSRASVPLALDRDPAGRFHMLGAMTIDKTLTAAESCDMGDGTMSAAQDRELPVPTLFDPGEKGWRPGKTLVGRRVDADPYSSVKTSKTYNWSLKPGR